MENPVAFVTARTLRTVTQSVTGCMPAQSVGTINLHHTDRSARSAWECLSGRSASDPRRFTDVVPHRNGKLVVDLISDNATVEFTS